MPGSGGSGSSSGSSSAAKLYDFAISGVDQASIDSAVDGTTVANFAGFTVLEVFVVARTDDAAALASISVRLNNDSGANYDRDFEGANDATQQAGSANAQTGWPIQTHGSGGRAAVPGVNRLTIPGYAATVFEKVAELTEASPDSTAANQFSGTFACLWRNTAAVTRIAVLAAGAAKLKVGSRLIVYGQ